ncbi:hypothetical protein ACC718_32790 [Rhizobium ruizarguesonis]
MILKLNENQTSSPNVGHSLLDRSQLRPLAIILAFEAVVAVFRDDVDGSAPATTGLGELDLARENLLRRPF